MDSTAYAITPDPNNNKSAIFSVVQPIEGEIIVIAKAKKNQNDTEYVCSAQSEIIVNKKSISRYSFDCAKDDQVLLGNYFSETDKKQLLKYTDPDNNEEKDRVNVKYYKKGEPNTGVSVTDKTKIPTLTLTETNASDLKIKMNNDASDFPMYNSIVISVDMPDTIYIFTIYPVKNNVYNGEFGKTDLNNFTYVPSDLETIAQKAVLDGTGYTYQYIDHCNGKDTLCEIRFSISSVTGVGLIEGFFRESSLYQWFMKRDEIYYKYYNGGWYYYKNGTAVWDGDKRYFTQYYWDLEEYHPVWLVIKNKKAWQKWN